MPALCLLRKFRVPLFLLPLLLNAACAATPPPRLLAPAAGLPVLAGATPEDHHRLAEIFQATPSYEREEWRSAPGLALAVTPRPVFRADGLPCRNALVERTLGEEKSVAEITACRQDGQWRITAP